MADRAPEGSPRGRTTKYGLLTMCRTCPVPGCEVLMTTTLPMCTKCWARVPEPIKQSIEIANAKLGRAMTESGRNVAKTELKAAHDMALAIAARKTTGAKRTDGKNIPGNVPA